eukprot:4504618-Karenia_brevis.AAC.1
MSNSSRGLLRRAYESMSSMKLIRSPRHLVRLVSLWIWGLGIEAPWMWSLGNNSCDHRFAMPAYGAQALQKVFRWVPDLLGHLGISWARGHT